MSSADTTSTATNTNSNKTSEPEDPRFPILEEVTLPYLRAHDDDIHACMWHRNGGFVSGSKDNTLKTWDMNEVGEISLEQKLRRSGDYTSWITALTCLGENDIMYGTRDGTVSTIDNGICETLDLDPGSLKVGGKGGGRGRDRGRGGGKGMATAGTGGPICKQRNASRVTTLYSVSQYDRGTSFLSHITLIGRPKELVCVNTARQDDGRHLSEMWRTNLHQNDWVYCILPLRNISEDSLRTCVVMGSSLDVFDINFARDVALPSSRLTSHVNVWYEDRRSVRRGNDRAHIAHLERLKKTDESLVAGACFDGTVRIFDMNTNVVQELGGHKGRCWQSLEYGPQQLLTCADDGYLRLWDLRMKENAFKIAHKGRVSCALQHPSSDLIVTGSCCDRPQTDNNKGIFRVFDVRYVSSNFPIIEADKDVSVLEKVDNHSAENDDKDGFQVQRHRKNRRGRRDESGSEQNSTGRYGGGRNGGRHGGRYGGRYGGRKGGGYNPASGRGDGGHYHGARHGSHGKS